MDLYRNDIHIAIQWETIPSSKNHPSKKGIRKEYLRDIKTYAQEGKMLFGWAIDSEMTEYPGSIKFSVRFFHFDNNGKLDFNLNTTPVTIGVLASIDYEIMDSVNTEVGTIVDKKDFLLGRLMDSPPPPEVENPPVPVWIDGFSLHGKPGDTFNTTDQDGVHVSKDLDKGSRTFIVKATAETGNIGYRWYRKKLDGVDYGQIIGANYDFIETEDKEYSSLYPYYVKVEEEDKDGNRIVKYQVVTDITSDMHGKPIQRDEKLYEKVGYCTVTQTGDYKVIAVNSMGLGTSITEEDEVKILRIPGPDVNSFVLQYATNYGRENIMPIEGENLSVELKATSYTAQMYDIVNTEWFEIDPITKEKIASLKTNSVKMDPDEELTDEVLTVELGDADYKLFDKTFIIEATAVRNGAEVPHDTPLEYRVTAPAQELKVESNCEYAKIPADGPVAVYVTAKTEDKVISDNITYQWWKMQGEIDGEPNDDREDIEIEGATEASIKIAHDGMAIEGAFALDGGIYYCIVTNHVNGTTHSQQSPIITIIPSI